MARLFLVLLLGCPAAAPPPDLDGDGWEDAEDCLPEDPEAFPGAEERCNGFDDDCDEQIDEGFDLDGDGFEPCDGDCDDTDPTVAPFAPELCNQRDDDCDGELGLDESLDQDDDGSPLCLDCDDQDSERFPSSPEHCDDVDHDCDGDPRTGEPAVVDGVTTWFGGDGFTSEDRPCDEAERILVCGDLRPGDEVANLDGISCAVEVTGSFALQAGNATFAELESIAGTLQVENSPSPLSLAFPALRSVGPLEILWAEASVALSLPALTEFGGLELRWCEGDVSVVGPAGGLATSGQLAITSNEGDVSVSGFSGPANLGEISVGGNSGALTLDGWAGPLSVNGDVTVGNNPQLVALQLGGDGLSLGGTLFLEGNASLSTAELGVSSTGGWFRVQDNPSLTLLDVPTLTTVGGNFVLADNAALASLAGFGSLESVSGNLSITDNASLPTAAAQALAASTSVGGEVLIEGNAP